MEKTDITIIGAGIVGLAISAQLSKKERNLFVLEKHDTFGQESSSRNSEVIHAGMYYPQESLKAKMCVEGNSLLYEICQKNNIAHKKLGKLIVAMNESEIAHLEELLTNGKKNGVKDLRMLSRNEIHELEPNISVAAALFSPHTGIVDSHNLMNYFYHSAKAESADFVFHSEVIGLEKESKGYKVTVRDADDAEFTFLSRIVINCGGLESEEIASLLSIDSKEAGYALHYCKGQYFRVHSEKRQRISRLIYPTPSVDGISLGIHATPDLGGGLRLGPDAHYIKKEEANYDIDDTQKHTFLLCAQTFLPFLKEEDLVGDTAGIRPKLQGPGEGFRDFIIREESDKGFAGLVNLIGIDSPGLTAAISIARYVNTLTKDML